MILVTGGSGLVGQEVLRALQADGIATAAMVRSERSRAAVERLGAHPLPGTVEDPNSWRELPPIEGVVHSAALIAQRQPWERFQQVNIEGTRLAAAAAKRHGVPLVHLSSVAVYGRRAGDDAPLSVAEDYRFGALAQHDFYARSKREAERIALAEGGSKAVALRPCVIYGPGDRLFLPRLLSFSRRGVIPLAGSGSNPLPLVHAASVALAVKLALTKSVGHWGRAYNTTGDAPVTARDVVAALQRAIGKKITTIRLPATLLIGLATVVERVRLLVGARSYPGSFSSAVRFWRGGDPYSSRAAREVLGWNPALNPTDALDEALAAASDTEA